MRFLFDVKLYAEVWLVADNEDDARAMVRNNLTVVGLPTGDIQLEAICDDAIRLAEDQPEQDA